MKKYKLFEKKWKNEYLISMNNQILEGSQEKVTEKLGEFVGELESLEFFGIHIDSFKKGEINFFYCLLGSMDRCPQEWNDIAGYPKDMTEKLIAHMKRYYKKYINKNLPTVDFIKWGIYD